MGPRGAGSRPIIASLSAMSLLSLTHMSRCVRTGLFTFSTVKLAGLANLEGVLAEEGIVDFD